MAQTEGISLKQAVLDLGCMTEAEFDETVDPVKLV